MKTIHPRSCSLDRGQDVYRPWTAKSFEHGFAALPKENISETDPQDVARLWEEVGVHTSRLPQSPRLATGSTEPSEKRSSRKTKAASPYDKDFGDRVLEPRSIITHHGLHSVKAHTHFEVEEPFGDRLQYYTCSRGATESSVWLRAEEAFVQDVTREYSCMNRRALCEAEFASYALEMLFRRERRVLDLDQERYERMWIPDRMIELVAKPTLNVWSCPPLVGKYAKAGSTLHNNYEFDLRPDCSYWLSLQGFNPEYRTQVKKYVFVTNKTIACPYLTVEFKKDDETEQVAWNRVAAAASVALYNRFLLR